MRFAAGIVVIIFATSLANAGPYEDAEAAVKAFDEERALVILQPLAAKGETRAQFEVGELLYLFKHQEAPAKKLFEAAAAKGHGEAMYFLANMYQNGKVVPQNYIEAYKWYILAVVHASPRKPGFGSPEEVARKNRDYLATKMTPAQIAEAQKRAQAWKPVQ
jgi:hypothetical protein